MTEENIGFYRQNDNYGFLSNLYPCDIKIDDIEFFSAEQAVHYYKAKLFNDIEIMDKILDCNYSYEAKDLGKQVNNFDQKIWKDNRVKIYTNVLMEKFKQNKDLLELLKSTENSILVNCSPYDRIWGIGFSKADKEFLNNESFKWGSNLLGKILMKVRDKL